MGDVINTNSGTSIELDIIVPKELQRQGILTNIMKKAVQEFNPMDVVTTWKYYATKYADFGRMSTNLKVFLENEKTLGAEAAAWKTPTGIAARKAGFTHVSVDAQTLNGKPFIQATFSK